MAKLKKAEMVRTKTNDDINKQNKLSIVLKKSSKKSKLEKNHILHGKTRNFVNLDPTLTKLLKSKSSVQLQKLEVVQTKHNEVGTNQNNKLSDGLKKAPKKSKLEKKLVIGKTKDSAGLDMSAMPLKNKKLAPSVPVYSTPRDVPKKTVTRAVNALLRVNEIQSNKNALFNEETVIFLQIICVKVSECPDRIVRFKLPHSLASSTSEVCLIVSDKKKGKRFDHEPQIEHWKDLLEEKGITEVKTVLPMRQLKTEFDQFELKRRLKTMHDFFLVDAKICGHVSHILGRVFRDDNVITTPVKIGKDEQDELKKTIQSALHKTPMRIHNAQSTATLRVGHVSMKQQQLSKNIRAVIEQLDTYFPGGSENVRSIHIKTPLSIAIPIYITLKPAASVKSIQILSKRPRLYKTVEDELSTIPGTRVQVAPDGYVKLIKTKDKAIESDDDTKDEKAKNESKANIKLDVDRSDNSFAEDEINDEGEDTHSDGDENMDDGSDGMDDDKEDGSEDMDNDSDDKEDGSEDVESE